MLWVCGNSSHERPVGFKGVELFLQFSPCWMFRLHVYLMRRYHGLLRRQGKILLVINLKKVSGNS